MSLSIVSLLTCPTRGKKIQFCGYQWQPLGHHCPSVTLRAAQLWSPVQEMLPQSTKNQKQNFSDQGVFLFSLFRNGTQWDLPTGILSMPQLSQFKSSKCCFLSLLKVWLPAEEAKVGWASRRGHDSQQEEGECG